MRQQTIASLFFTFIVRIQYILILALLFLPSSVAAQEKVATPLLLHAARVFDGHEIRTNVSVLISDGQVTQIGPRAPFNTHSKIRTIDLGDATILPGFIELHAHLSYQKVPADTVLRHGITTIRDLGGPIHKPYGGDGSLRVLTSGPIITAPHGYPIIKLGATNIAVAVSSEKEARETVRSLIDKGAAVIKVALEPGGEAGAPWSSHHDHTHHDQSRHVQHADTHHPLHQASHAKPWPLLSEEIVTAIVDEAHQHNRKVTAHIAEATGAQIAINAGVDEWAHTPCDPIPEPLLKQAVSQNVKIISTIDTLSKCSGIAHNAASWTALGGEFLYGAEIAHPDIPWGIDAQELMYLMQMAKMELIDVLRAATSKAGQHLNIPLLGTLQPGAPADLIAVRGNPMHTLKSLEYPDLVVSGGQIILNHF
ncbi:amidohydrolase family protein [Nitrosomonas sp. Nm166]|uniref:amidohydrolase family protein n=1 Tax=Nitrosomonas sp. Nm166 TaxID=1881054 RepID=UPI0008EF532B|nr:amidohydrolase family protein [Nitrosomonas sp. Nm166]SFE34425.1 Imidazolonepropionase [Nitrosomonas sp. Nm166]